MYTNNHTLNHDQIKEFKQLPKWFIIKYKIILITETNKLRTEKGEGIIEIVR